MEKVNNKKITYFVSEGLEESVCQVNKLIIGTITLLKDVLKIQVSNLW